VSLFRSEPGRLDADEPTVGFEEQGRATRTQTLAVATLACSRCDAPVAPIGAMAPSDPLSCPFCLHEAGVRDFLSLTAPLRPARVAVTVVMPTRVRLTPATAD
jgi:hypothetical protein